jgi:hypothetical protein
LYTAPFLFLFEEGSRLNSGQGFLPKAKGAWAMNIGNWFMSGLLRSPFHPILSKSFLVITLTVRKSGRPISLPVNYSQVDGALVVTSKRDRLWWRNLRGGAAVTLRLQGRDRAARADAIEDPAQVADGLRRLFAARPSLAGMYSVHQNNDGTWNPEDLSRLVDNTLQIRLTLTDH